MPSIPDLRAATASWDRLQHEKVAGVHLGYVDEISDAWERADYRYHGTLRTLPGNH